MPRDPNDLPIRYGQMTKAVKGLDRAFEDLSKTGKVNAQTLQSLVPVLVMLNPALGAVAAAGMAVWRSFEMVKQVDLQDAIRDMDERLRAASDSFETSNAVMAATVGKAASVAGEYGNVARQQAFITQEERKFADIQSMLTQKMKEKGEASGYEAIQLGHQGDEILKNIAYARTQIAQSQETIRVTEEETRALEAQARARAQLLKTQDDDATMMARLNLLQTHQVDNALEISGAQEALLDDLDAEKLHRDQLIETLRQQQEQTGATNQEQEQELRQSEEQIALLERQSQAFKDAAAAKSAFVGGTVVAAFDAYNAALDKTISLNNLFSDSTGRAFRNAEAQVLRGVGNMAAVHVAEELALAATTALSPAQAALYGPAPAHLAAAGQWAAVAALAGVGAGAMSVAPGGGGGAGGVGGGMGQPPVNQQITIIGTLDQRDLESLSSQLHAAVNSRSL